MRWAEMVGRGSYESHLYFLFLYESTENRFISITNLLKSPNIARYVQCVQKAILIRENVVTLHVENQRRAP